MFHLFILTTWVELAFSIFATPLVLVYLYTLLTSALNYGVKVLLSVNGLGLLLLTTSHASVAVWRLGENREWRGADVVANLPLFLHELAYNSCSVSQLMITAERMVIGAFPRLYVQERVSRRVIIGICVLLQVFVAFPCTMLVQDGPTINGRKLYTATEFSQKASVILAAVFNIASLVMVVISFTQSSARYNRTFFNASLATRHQVKEVILLTRVLIPVCISSILFKAVIITLSYIGFSNMHVIDRQFTILRFCSTAAAVVEPALLLSRHPLLRKRLRLVFGISATKVQPAVVHDPVTVADVYFEAFNNDLNRRTVN